MFLIFYLLSHDVQIPFLIKDKINHKGLNVDSMIVAFSKCKHVMSSLVFQNKILKSWKSAGLADESRWQVYGFLNLNIKTVSRFHVQFELDLTLQFDKLVEASDCLNIYLH
jgi:hypothetical protein